MSKAVPLALGIAAISLVGCGTEEQGRTPVDEPVSHVETHDDGDLREIESMIERWDCKDAARMIERTVKEHRGNPAFHILSGRVHLCLGEEGSAQISYKTALSAGDRETPNEIDKSIFDWYTSLYRRCFEGRVGSGWCYDQLSRSAKDLALYQSEEYARATITWTFEYLVSMESQDSKPYKNARSWLKDKRNPNRDQYIEKEFAAAALALAENARRGQDHRRTCRKLAATIDDRHMREKIQETLDENSSDLDCVNDTYEDLKEWMTVLQSIKSTYKEYPQAGTLEELIDAIDGTYSFMPLATDAWGTPFEAVSDRHSFMIVSAGSDREFELRTRVPSNEMRRATPGFEFDIIMIRSRYVQYPETLPPEYKYRRRD